MRRMKPNSPPHKLKAAALAVGRAEPVPKLPERKRLKLEKEAAIAEAKAEQEREAAALAALQPGSHPASATPEDIARPAKQAKISAE